ncbi:hypothetical protein [Pararhodospirillum photometricum]|uniref:hypothetical protein n=1 Tax=Pararhodospirillum photometricum TaxID=1084 RepID=UPI000313F08D|nr:hypothetical protein [Pararhodospirillum photometricum]
MSLARALLGRAPLLILDEPGEGLDPALEARVLARVLAAAGDRPVLLITHRPQGLDLLETVAYMEKGQVVELGEPFALARAGGPFQRFLERCAV